MLGSTNCTSTLPQSKETRFAFSIFLSYLTVFQVIVPSLVAIDSKNRFQSASMKGLHTFITKETTKLENHNVTKFKIFQRWRKYKNKKSEGLLEPQKGVFIPHHGLQLSNSFTCPVLHNNRNDDDNCAHIALMWKLLKGFNPLRSATDVRSSGSASEVLQGHVFSRTYIRLSER